jgi:hypothetical protein
VDFILRCEWSEISAEQGRRAGSGLRAGHSAPDEGMQSPLAPAAAPRPGAGGADVVVNPRVFSGSNRSVPPGGEGEGGSKVSRQSTFKVGHSAAGVDSGKGMAL